MTISELVTYNGKDREQVLYAGAKSEGKVTWYTSLAGDSYKAMIKAFETKYPGVKIEAYRANGARDHQPYVRRKPRPERTSSIPSKPPKPI